jgi:undecaprenyl-diphosphatase
MDKNKLKKRYLYSIYIIAILWLGILLIFMRDSFTPGGGNVDRQVINVVINTRTTNLNPIFIFITNTGNTIPTIIIASVITLLFIYYKKNLEAAVYPAYVLLIFLFNEGIKDIVKRPRPGIIRLVSAGNYSFPSGHAMISMGSMLFLTYLIIIHINKKRLSMILRIILILYTVVLGLSRVYVGVHYISDVIGGWFFASVYAGIGIQLYDFIVKRVRGE